MKFFFNGKSKYFIPVKLRKADHSTGFTLIEILIVVSIIIVLSVIVLANYELGGYQLVLQRAAYKLSQDLRGVGGMAMSYKTFQGSVPAGGYGIFLDTADPSFSSYVLFADKNSNGFYESDELIEIIEIEKSVRISQLCLDPNPCACGATMNIVFTPSQSIKFNNENATSCSAKIELWSDKTGENMTVWVRPTGLVELTKGGY